MQNELSLVGRTIAGKYRLARVRAAGAFGTVFAGEQFFCRHFVRPVAVKVSRETGLTERNAPYLFSDALILAQLMAGPHRAGRQHLVPIFDMGLLPECDGRGFLVMELVEGAPLLDHIRAAGQLGVSVGLRYFQEICRALALVHAQGAVHRDLKPDNILVDRTGVVRVVDFGLATFTDPRLGFAPGSMGTFTYMAPETLLGRSTAAADVYSLGLLAYEIFTGGGPHLTAPWSGKPENNPRADPYRLKTALSFPPPSAVHNEIRNDHRWLDELILCCLATDPDRRYQDAGQVLAAIEAGQAGEPLPEVQPLPRRDKEPFPLPGPAADTGAAGDPLLRQARRLLARQDFASAIDHLDIHRPAEWAVVDRQGAHILRLLAKAYLGKGDWSNARDCLTHLRNVQKEQPLLPPLEYLTALTDYLKCCHKQNLKELAEDAVKEMRTLAVSPTS
jgi:serine/threonine-protein kinase